MKQKKKYIKKMWKQNRPTVRSTFDIILKEKRKEFVSKEMDNCFNMICGSENIFHYIERIDDFG